jgi:hypothetical protein
LAQVYFRGGDVYSTQIKGAGMRLGARLISAGHASHEDIEEALQIQGKEGGSRRLGKILVDEGFLTAEELHHMVRQQMEDVVFEILRWDGGSFRFEAAVSTEEDVVLEVSVENLIMEGARRFREWHHLTRRVPSLDSIPKFSPAGDAVEVALTPEEWSLVSRVDGNTTITDLAVQCGFTDLEAARTVLGLLTTGLLDLTLPPGVVPTRHEEGMDAMFDELEKALEEAASRQEGSPSLSLDQLVGTEEPGAEPVPEPEVVEPEVVEPEVVEPEVVEPEVVEPEVVEPEVVEPVEIEAEPEPVPEPEVKEAEAKPEVVEPKSEIEAPAKMTTKKKSPSKKSAAKKKKVSAKKPAAKKKASSPSKAKKPPVAEVPEEVLEPIIEEPVFEDPVAEKSEETFVTEPLLDELATIDEAVSGTQEPNYEADAPVPQADAPVPQEIEEPVAASAYEETAVDLPVEEHFDGGSVEPRDWDLPSPPADPMEITAVTEAISVDPTVHLVAQEVVSNGQELRHSYTSLAREFADLAAPMDEPRVTQTEPEPPPEPEAEVPQVPDQTKKSGPDPGVDVSSLIREFTSLGRDDRERD